MLPLAADYKKYGQLPLFQRPNGDVDVQFAASAAAAGQTCMNFEQSRTYRIPPPPISTNIKLADVVFSVSIGVVEGTRLAVRHR